jgi:hypothetical protein
MTQELVNRRYWYLVPFGVVYTSPSLGFIGKLSAISYRPYQMVIAPVSPDATHPKLSLP